MKLPLTLYFTSLWFLVTLSVVVCNNREILSIKKPKSGEILKRGHKIDVTWEVPRDVGFMNFTVELWSLNTIQAGSSKKLFTLGHTDSTKAQGQQFTIPWKIPYFKKQMKTGYFIAVYGNKLSKGPRFSWVYPWDDIFYGRTEVLFS
ncbi:hypothetical protein K7432_011628 [Basidiobolus ranarum]|uniref:Uncharacterized protein n=1 Tax=Basidiobolus ranarum TaxID=34480 RepID=A0ABR2WM45_9FUNG